MRYMLAMLLVLGMGIAAGVPSAFAESANGGADGRSVERIVAPVVVQAEPGNLGTVSGPTVPTPMPFYGGDRN